MAEKQRLTAPAIGRRTTLLAKSPEKIDHQAMGVRLAPSPAGSSQPVTVRQTVSGAQMTGAPETVASVRWPPHTTATATGTLGQAMPAPPVTP
nr:hypothetical protein [Aureimonas sp. AU4]